MPGSIMKVLFWFLSSEARFCPPRTRLFLKNNQPDGHADNGDERYLNRQQYHLPPEEPPQLHDKDIFAEESLKRNLK
jgi:hypothetical protein